MSKVLSRVGRVSGRIMRSLSQLRSTSKLILGIIALFAAGVLTQHRVAVSAWLVAEWTHWAFVGAGVLLLCALVALYGMEREADALKIVQVRPGEIKTSLRPILHFNSDRDERDILIYEVDIKFRNDSDKTFRAFFPELELYRKKGRRTWERMSFRRINDSLHASVHQRGLPNERSRWYHNRRYEIAARDETIVHFYLMETAPEGASAFLDYDFKLRATMDFIGQPKEILEIPLPRVTDEYYRVEKSS